MLQLRMFMELNVPLLLFGRGPIAFRIRGIESHGEVHAQRTLILKF